MKKILQINVTSNWGSTGKIAEDLGNLIIKNGWESWIASGRQRNKSNSHEIVIGNSIDKYYHALQTRIFDRHGLASRNATKKFIEKVREISPDLIHLHNIHGYYLNYPLLFDFLKEWGGPVVWTMHDCWAFTGHCAYYTMQKCEKWQTHCHHCPITPSYPGSILADNSHNNYALKKKYFTSLDNLTLVPVSNWLAGEISKSFLREYPMQIIYNGINVNVFKPTHTTKPSLGLEDKFTILGVSNVWDKRKGLMDFIKLREQLDNNYQIVLIGVNKSQTKELPSGIKALMRTENVKELVDFYSVADVFFNPSLEESFGLTTVEAMACGTPVIVYDSAASPELVTKQTGFVCEPHDIAWVKAALSKIDENSLDWSTHCRERVEKYFSKDSNYDKYVNLYKELMAND